MAILAVLLFLCRVGGAAEHPLVPTDGFDPEFRVVADEPPTAHIGRVYALPIGTTLTVTSGGSRAFTTFLIAPTRLVQSERKGSWSSRLDEPGGYKLQFGSERAEFLPQLDFVVTADTSTLAQGGTALADGLYEGR